MTMRTIRIPIHTVSTIRHSNPEAEDGVATNLGVVVFGVCNEDLVEVRAERFRFRTTRHQCLGDRTDGKRFLRSGPRGLLQRNN